MSLRGDPAGLRHRAGLRHLAGFWQRVRRLSGRTPLRVKLISAVLALVAAALLVISLIGIGVLQSNLLGQVDSQLTSATRAIRVELRSSGIQLPAAMTYQIGEAVIWVPDNGPQQYVVAPVGASGFGQQQVEQPIPGPAIGAEATSLPSDPQHPVTVGSVSGNGRWLVVGLPSSAQSGPDSSQAGVVVVAASATGAYHTISVLTWIDLIVSLAVLLALAAVGTAVVRASLRPLTDIEQTAGAIAAGDLSRRVPERDPRTEVGRLGRSLNTMLAQIEHAFRARADSESAARRSEERMRQFVADASHELRTPLTAIRGFAEYYRQRGGQADPPGEAGPPGPPGPPGQADQAGETGQNGRDGRNGSLGRADLDRIMRRVEQESARMGVLVEDMLLLARLDQQRPLDHSPVDLLTLAADAVHDARMVAPDRSINLSVGGGAAPLVLGDEVRLRQVVGNLMSNALVHTPAGSPVDVRIRPGTLDQGQPAGNPHPAVVMEVADRGPGLSPEQAAHVFERFYRADQARTAGGTGLGLAIVAALVAAHGGTAWVNSPPGGGAVFGIALPLAPEAIGHDQGPGELDPGPGDQPVPGQPEDSKRTRP